MNSFSKLQWMDAVRRCAEISPMQRLVILHIGDTADKDGNRAWRKNDTVVAELGINKDTVACARKRAAERGLWVETVAARGGRNGGGRTAEYRLTIPDDLVRARPDDSVKWSGADTEMVRPRHGNGPAQTGKWSGADRTPSGSSSGISSGSSSEPDPWADYIPTGDTHSPPGFNESMEEEQEYPAHEDDYSDEGAA